MKKIYFAIALLVGLNVSMAQTKSSGTIFLNSLMTLKIDKNATSSIVTVTLTGPSDKWFGIGFNALSMSNGTDCLYYTTSLVDSGITGNGAPTTDDTNEWTVISNNLVSGTTRSLVVTRNFVGGTGDYIFSYADSGLNIIWAYGSSSTLAYHSSRGSAALGFTLGVEDFTALDKTAIAPNPSNGVFTISKNSQTIISKITIYDINAKVLKVIDSELDLETIQIDLSKLSKGVYFVEFINATDKVVKKIVLE
jgi:hypothetical protein